MLPRRRLPKSAIAITELGFGAASVGNLYAPLSDEVARNALDAALEAGFGYFDTAPRYGFGLSERRVGDALRGKADLAISTKVGRLLEPDARLKIYEERQGFCSPLQFREVFDYRHDAILRSFEDSLQRLGLARVDILYVHDIGRGTHGEAADHYFEQLTTGGGLRALEKLRSQGAISAFGLGVNEMEVCLQILDFAEIDLILLAGRYTLLEQHALTELFPVCEQRDVAVIVGGPYNSGILASGTGSGAGALYNYAPAADRIVQRVKRIEEVCRRHHVALKAAALQFPLAHPTVACVIPGLSNSSQVLDTLELYRCSIPPDFWNELRFEGLLAHDAPVPAGACR